MLVVVDCLVVLAELIVDFHAVSQDRQDCKNATNQSQNTEHNGHKEHTSSLVIN